MNIVLKNVRTHNLKGIDIEIPLYKWTVVTGVSGSGKSSLVFDTLYAENQRCFIETLGVYERQFVQNFSQGVFDKIEPLLPAIGLKQISYAQSYLSTVSTVSDLEIPLKLLFSACMDEVCVHTGYPVMRHSLEEAIVLLKNLKKDLWLGISLVIPEESMREMFWNTILAEGYERVIFQNKIYEIEGNSSLFEKDVYLLLGHFSEDDFDEMVWQDLWFRLTQSNQKEILIFDENSFEILNSLKLDYYCMKTGLFTKIAKEEDLDWNGEIGACPRCKGAGVIFEWDDHKIIEDETKRVEESLSLSQSTHAGFYEGLSLFLEELKINKQTQWFKLDENIKNMILGNMEISEKIKKIYCPVKVYLDMINKKHYGTPHYGLMKFQSKKVCPVCGGKKLSLSGQNARIENVRFVDLMNMEIKDVLSWLPSLKENKKYKEKEDVLKYMYEEIELKLSCLLELGLSSVFLWRKVRTLSGGEFQRVLLTKVLGAHLSQTLYIFDEPSVGLGLLEVESLVKVMRKLMAQGNTLVVVDHDKRLIAEADEVIELGPRGGAEGGFLLQTGKFIPKSSLMEHSYVQKRFLHKGSFQECLRLVDFSCCNISHLNLDVPLKQLVVITGVSGSGKSTLLQRGLLEPLEWLLENKKTTFQDDEVFWSHFEICGNMQRKLSFLKQQSGKVTKTSMLLTYLGISDTLRQLFSKTKEAKSLSLKLSDFSVNSSGACPECQGKGYIEENLFFLGKVEEVCPVCKGDRFKKEVLPVTLLGKNIVEWMKLTVDEAKELFKKINLDMYEILERASFLGLGYLNLGVKTNELSGGEYQRLRICESLSQCKSLYGKEMGYKTIHFIDEPTRGLSEYDIERLLRTFLSLIEQGHSFIVAEHHEAFVQAAHTLITLGPGAGALGGKILSIETVENSK